MTSLKGLRVTGRIVDLNFRICIVSSIKQMFGHCDFGVSTAKDRDIFDGINMIEGTVEELYKHLQSEGYDTSVIVGGDSFQMSEGVNVAVEEHLVEVVKAEVALFFKYFEYSVR